MMMTLDFVLILLAFVCFVMASFGVNVRNVNLIPLGLAFWVQTLLV